MSMIGVDLRGIDQVIQNYLYRQMPNYQVVSGKDLKFFYAGDNIDEGREVLENNLKVVEANGSTAIYKIVYFSEAHDGKLNKNDIVGSVTFKLVTPEESYERYSAKVGGIVRGSDLSEIKELLTEKLTSIESRLNALENKEEEEEEEEEQTGGVTGFLNGLVEDPQIKAVLVNELIGLVSKVKGSNNNKIETPVQQTQPAALGNISNEDIAAMNNAIVVLMQNGMTAEDLVKLASIAENDQNQFKFLLNLLRQQS